MTVCFFKKSRRASRCSLLCNCNYPKLPDQVLIRKALDWWVWDWDIWNQTAVWFKIFNRKIFPSTFPIHHRSSHEILFVQHFLFKWEADIQYNFWSTCKHDDHDYMIIWGEEWGLTELNMLTVVRISLTIWREQWRNWPEQCQEQL